MVNLSLDVAAVDISKSRGQLPLGFSQTFRKPEARHPIQELTVASRPTLPTIESLTAVEIPADDPRLGPKTHMP
jgi:hypothetical protein